MNRLLLDSDQFIICINDNLTDYKRQIITFLYMPIIGQKATNLFFSLFNFVKAGELESSIINHQQLFKIMQVKKASDFAKEREKLEAAGLLETYYYQSDVNAIGLYYYLLKDVLSPYEFFTDPALSQLFRLKVGDEAMQIAASNFLVRRYDINKFTNITKTFDEVFEVKVENEPSFFESWWVDTKNTGIKVKNKVFDFDLLMTLLGSLDIVDMKEIKTKDFYELVNRYGFFYQLNAEEMKNVILLSVEANQKINYDKLKKVVVDYYNQKNTDLVVEPKVINPAPKNNIIHILETTNPDKIVGTHYGVKLTGAEIQLFEQLMAKTKVSLGIINTLLIYVIEEKKGIIPSYNYFEKVLNGWLRSGVKTTEDAVNKINERAEWKKTTYKKEKLVPGWFENFVEASSKTPQEKPKIPSSTLEELKAFFNPIKKED